MVKWNPVEFGDYLPHALSFQWPVRLRHSHRMIVNYERLDGVVNPSMMLLLFGQNN